MNKEVLRTMVNQDQGRFVASWSSWIITAVLVCTLPVIGVLISGGDVSRYLEFPPEALYVAHAPFQWRWWTFYALSGVLLTTALTRCLKLKVSLPHRPGGISLVSGLFLSVTWIIAWQRWEWAAPIQHHTFIAVWGSYIVLMNALMYEIHGVSPFVRQPYRYLLSFPVSAVLWWGFEFLNRFTQNWEYLNDEHFSPLSYTIFASLSFATVLPSMWVTKEFLARTVVSSDCPVCTLSLRRCGALMIVLVSATALVCLPLAPDYLFALIWVAPLVMLVACESLRRPGAHTFTEISVWGLSGVWCGVLWELWNVHSLAKWVYHIPFVERFYLFEMPVVGYAGYIPFGILCGMAILNLAVASRDGSNAPVSGGAWCSSAPVNGLIEWNRDSGWSSRLSGHQRPFEGTTSPVYDAQSRRGD